MAICIPGHPLPNPTFEIIYEIVPYRVADHDELLHEGRYLLELLRSDGWNQIPNFYVVRGVSQFFYIRSSLDCVIIRAQWCSNTKFKHMH